MILPSLGFDCLGLIRHLRKLFRHKATPAAR
jgi:hypothetical protein